MKKIFLLLAVIIGCGLKNTLLAQHAIEDFKKLDWLEGTWMRINNKPGRSAHEKWQKIFDINHQLLCRHSLLGE